MTPKSVLDALSFLTVLPVRPSHGEDDIAGSLGAFPLVGLLIGAFGAGAWHAAAWLWGSPLLAAVAAVGATTVVSGALHLDGLADTCDAVFSWRSRERKLEIMRDSRIGTMGALGLLLGLLGKIGALVALGPAAPAAVAVSSAWGRWADVYGIRWFPAAREGGVGRTFHAMMRPRDFAWATATALLAGGLLLPPWGAVLGLAVWTAAHGAARRLTASLGGLTGDTYGALSEGGELVFLLALAAVLRHLPA